MSSTIKFVRSILILETNYKSSDFWKLSARVFMAIIWRFKAIGTLRSSLLQIVHETFWREEI